MYRTTRFSDASMSGYGACVYLRFVMSNGNIKLAFVSSKSRVAPISSKQTIPRLEFMGNLILSRLVVSIMGCLCEEMDISASFCYTDSQISLAWIKGVGKEYKTFIQNRVLEIRSNVEASHWLYCNTENNPADLITRVNLNNLDNAIWLNWPNFYMIAITSKRLSRWNTSWNYRIIKTNLKK